MTLRFNKAGPDLKDALEQFGVMPLPPYIKREAAGDDADKDDYQTLSPPATAPSPPQRHPCISRRTCWPRSMRAGSSESA